jgi:hypothetical protein
MQRTLPQLRFWKRQVGSNLIPTNTQQAQSLLKAI